MTRVTTGIIAVGVFLAITGVGRSPAHATDNVFQVQIKEALASSDAKDKLDGSIRFYFGDSPHPVVSRSFGNFVTNKKSNGFGKSSKSACNWVFLSALLQLQQRANEEGGNAVINIHSYYKKHDVSSATQIECHKGFTIAGVALKGDVVKLSGQ